MAGHDNRHSNMRSVEAKVGDQCFAETTNRKLRGTVRGVWIGRTNRRENAVDGAGVDYVSLVGRHQHGQERSRAEIDAAPINVERSLPRRSIVVDETPGPGNAGIIEEQINERRRQFSHDELSKRNQLRFVSNVGAKHHHFGTCRR